MQLHAGAQERGLDLHSSLARAKTDSQKINAYNHLLTYYKYVNVDSAIYYAEQGLQYAINKKYLMGQGIMMSQLGQLDEGQGRSTLAKQRLGYAMQIFREQNYLAGVAAMDNSLGSLEAGKGNYDIAIRYFIAAVELHEKIADDEGLLLSYTNLGALYMQHQDTANAAKYLTLAEQISKKQPVSDATISLYNYIGILHAARGDKQGALQYFQNDVKLSDNPRFMNAHAQSLLYLGSFYNDMGDVESAIVCFNEGLKVARQNNLSEPEANILLELSAIYKTSKPDLAMNYLEDAMVICDNTHSSGMLVKLYKQMSEIYEREGRYKEALRAFKSKQAIEDSIVYANKAIEVANLGATNELRRSNAKIKNLEIINKKKDRQRNLIILASLLGASITAVIIVLYLKTRNLNDRLIKHEKELNDLNNTKNKLFSIIGHDLRWPVARIPQVLVMCDDPSTSAEERTYLMESLKEHTTATVETLDKLLYWGQSLMKGVNLKQVKFKPGIFIEDSIDLKKISADDKEITVVDKVPPLLEVFADPTHFDFIMRNLLANAIKFTGIKGHIEVGVDEAMKAGYAVFYVKDNGIGIDPERLAKIFEPFNSKDGTAAEKGTGIGLMLCKEFALKNDGDIWAESELQKGTTFYYSVKKAVDGAKAA